MVPVNLTPQSIDPGFVGGIAEMKWIAEYADLHGILMAPHGVIDGLFGLAAHVHMCAVMPQNLIAFECPRSSAEWWYDIVSGLPEKIVVDGFVDVLEAPGLGVEMDKDAIEKYRVEKADHSLPKRLVKVIRAGGINIYFANSGQKWTFFQGGNHPVDEWGSHTELLDDDGSGEFADLHARAAQSPVLTSE